MAAIGEQYSCAPRKSFWPAAAPLGAAKSAGQTRDGTHMARTLSKASITSEGALEAIRAAEQKAAEIGVPMCIAVVDESGVLKGFSRMDGAALLSVDTAQDKAYTAVSFGIPTH